ncbi:MAG: DUF4124 domain-containing protein [Nitrospirota bacterium]
MNIYRQRSPRAAKILGLALAVVITFSLAPAALAGAVYQWTDADGAIHFTDDPGKIPKKFRDTVKEIRPPDEPDEPEGGPSSEPEAQPRTQKQPEPASEPEPAQVAPSEPVDARGHNEKWWRQRVQEWQDQKADAQAKLADAQERLGRERFLNATTGNMLRIQEISAEVEMYEKQIREAENMLTEILPDEARKAQAPPGWLRE